MNNSRPTQPQPHHTSAGMTAGDIYYVLFRHKWKIIILSLAGITAAVAIYCFNPPPYQSVAELMIQYVPEATAQALPGGEQKVIIPDSGAGIINSEIQILTSLDVAEQAATNIGPASVLAAAGGGGNAIAAASLIRNNLMVQPVGNGSSVILVTFKHPDPRIVQPVLQEVINDYLQKHKEIHSPPGGFDEALSREQSSFPGRRQKGFGGPDCQNQKRHVGCPSWIGWISGDTQPTGCSSVAKAREHKRGDRRSTGPD